MGVNIPKLLLKALKPLASTIGLKTAVLVKSTPGIRTVGSISAGTNPTTKSYPCQALISVFTADEMPGTLVQVDDRTIGILGASLPVDVTPAPNNTITIADLDGAVATFRLIAPIAGDGVGAYYEFRARK